MSLLTPEELEKLTDTMKAYLDGHPAEDPVVNPLFADLSGLPPMLVQAATGDLILPGETEMRYRFKVHVVASDISRGNLVILPDDAPVITTTCSANGLTIFLLLYT